MNLSFCFSRVVGSATHTSSDKVQRGDSPYRFPIGFLAKVVKKKQNNKTPVCIAVILPVMNVVDSKLSLFVSLSLSFLTQSSLSGPTTCNNTIDCDHNKKATIESALKRNSKRNFGVYPTKQVGLYSDHFPSALLTEISDCVASSTLRPRLSA